MHELSRLAYLQAMGVDSYVSRRPLAGAAPTRRLALLSTPIVETPAQVLVAQTSPAQTSPAQTSPLRDKPAIDLEQQPRKVSTPDSAATASVAHAKRQRAPAPEKFCLTTVIAGEWLWLEDLAGMPMTQDQVWLISGMAQALGLSAARHRGTAPPEGRSSKPDIAQFDWPIHTNDQFDLGDEAAQASVAGFVSRRLDQFQCRGLVLLGQDSQRRLAAHQIAVPMVTTTSSTAQMLAQPALKAQVWRDLAPLQQA